jgi:hypothetical protein
MERLRTELGISRDRLDFLTDLARSGVAPLHRPGADISRHAVAVLRSISRGHPAGWVAADRAYTNAIADDFQLPARALGFRPVLDYRDDQLGVQGEHEGFLLIEVTTTAPAFPTT